MNPLAIQAGLSLLQSGKLDGLLGGLPLLDKLGGIGGLKDIIGPDVADPKTAVSAALATLADHVPADPAQAATYLDAVTKTLAAAAALKALGVR